MTKYVKPKKTLKALKLILKKKEKRKKQLHEYIKLMTDDGVRFYS